MSTLFSVAGIQSAWVQFLAAPLGVQFGIFLAVVASVALLSFLAYKLYKKVTGPKITESPVEAQLVDQQSVAPDSKPGLGLRLKNWWNRPTIINGMDKKLKDLHTSFQNHTSSSQQSLKSLDADLKAVDSKLNTKLDEKIVELNALLEKSKSESASKIENLEKRLAIDLTKQARAVDVRLQTSQEQSTSQLKALDNKLNGLEGRTAIVENNTAILHSKMQAFDGLRNAASQMSVAAATFVHVTQQNPVNLPPLTSAANDGRSDGSAVVVDSDEEEGATLSSPRAAVSSPRAGGQR